MNRPWLSQYPPGVPAQIDIHACASLKDMLTTCCARFTELPAYSSMGTVLSFRELDEASRAFAAWLQKEARLKRGDRVALMLPNLLQVPVALFGILRAGLVVVNVNPLDTPRKLRHLLNDSGAVAVVVLENFAHTLAEVIASTPVRTVITTQVGDLLTPFKRLLTNLVVKHVKKPVLPWRLDAAVGFRQVLAAGRARTFDEVTLGHDDLAFLQYTGGTTGVAKGAMLSHGNMVANVLQVAAWISPGMKDGAETLVIPLPLYHVFALTGMLSFFSMGTQTVLVANPRDLPAFIRVLGASRPSAIIGVNTLFRALLDAPGFAELDLGRLKLAVAGGMAVQQTVAHRWKQATGVPLVEGYGLTESAPVAIANPVDIAEWSGGIGVPLPSTDAAIVDGEGRPLPPGEVGEIALRGPQVMKGYWNRPEDTAQALRPDGWLRTGDMGAMDERGSFRLRRRPPRRRRSNRAEGRVARTPAPYRPRRLVLRDGRAVTLRAITASDAPAIQRAFDRLSSDSRYSRFLHHKKHLSPEALARGVHPVPGRDFVFVATVPRPGGFDVVGAAQYVRATPDDDTTCEFAITVAEDWRSCGLARHLLACLLRKARRDRYAVMMGLVLAANAPMLALTRKLGFSVEPSSEGGNVVQVLRRFEPGREAACDPVAPR